MANLIKTQIENDELLPGQEYFVASIIDSNKIEKAKDLDMVLIKSFGTFSEQEAHKKAQELRLKEAQFHYTIGKVGYLSPFDIEKTEEAEYGNKKLNRMTKKLKENQEKYELMKDQFDNEHTITIGKHENKEDRTKKTKERMKKKVELSENTSKIGPKKLSEEILKEIENTFNVDYLNEDVVLADHKFTVLTTYDLSRYRNLKEFSFKIRGCFASEQNDQQGNLTKGSRHIKKLKEEFPYDSIGTIHSGYWAPVYKYGTTDSGEMQLKKANYLMKLYLDDFEQQQIEYKKHKQEEKRKIMKRQKEQQESDKAIIQEDIEKEKEEDLDEDYLEKLETLRKNYQKVKVNANA